MCTFQEAYSRRVYAKFMGQDAQNPRSDYERRLANFDRARRAGVHAANPGVLVGLSADVAFEMMAAILHVRHLLATGWRCTSRHRACGASPAAPRTSPAVRPA